MRRWISVLTLLSALAIGFATTDVSAESRRAARDDGPLARLGRALRPKWTRKTLGGRLLWTDVVHQHGWRIQQNVVTGHHRLLDADNVRHHFGSFDACVDELLDTVPARERLRPVDRIVVVVHGLGNWSGCLHQHTRDLRDEGYTVVPFDYASTFISIDRAAGCLERVIASLPPSRRIDFVGHSMGGIVIRTLLSRTEDPRFGRAVMLGSPNNGAELARMLRKSLLFNLTCGPGGRQLAGGEGSFLDDLPAPPIEFACIAGGRSERGYNPFLKGDDDGLVRVESVRLVGASDFALVPAHHHALLHDEDVRAMTARFLSDGCLRATGLREPIR